MRGFRPPAVAGLFYPEDADSLSRMVDGYLGTASPSRVSPKALIAPHAGYAYSGPIAASAYKAIAGQAHRIRRVVLLGPPHRQPVRGFAVPSVDAFRTPLGDVAIDREGISAVLAVPGVEVNDSPHEPEHSLEVHLPFLQRILGDFAVLPVLVGTTAHEDTDRLLRAVWAGKETLIVVSSDLSHYHGYDDARQLDLEASRAIETLDGEEIADNHACGRFPIKGLLCRAADLDLRVTRLDLRNSGDTAGRRDRSRVVGYGAWALEYGAHARLEEQTRSRLLDEARRAVLRGLDGEGPPKLDPEDEAPELASHRASFVTLQLDGTLRGCVGSLKPHQALISDVATNAYRAAFEDRRFAPLKPAEMENLELSISILSHPRPISFRSEAEAINALRPDTDGVILKSGEQRALFLPQVWASLRHPREFLQALKQKAGLAADAWSDEIHLWRF
ncbi:MAG: AmmeMemoRadiSam system protein B, partial [Alphaproteobacteria bacterium]